jgi:uncharacterized membrane protein YphA (DoxX/SURF4 family)
MRKALRFAGFWILPSLMGALFVLIGLGKNLAPRWQRNFERWGYPDGAYAVVGILEMVGGLLLLVPRLTPLAAGGLGVILVGAIGTHVAFGEMNRLFTPVLYLGILGVSAWIRRPRHERAAASPTVAR